MTKQQREDAQQPAPMKPERDFTFNRLPNEVEYYEWHQARKEQSVSIYNPSGFNEDIPF